MGRQQKLFKAAVPDLKKFIGRKVKIRQKDGSDLNVKIKTVVGNVGMTLGRQTKDIRPQYYEVNGEHLISMLRFHAQMEGATDITEEEFKAFEEMEFWAEKSAPNPLHESDPEIMVDPEALKKGEVKLIKGGKRK